MTKEERIQELREKIKKGICSNCGLRNLEVCEVCQIDFEKATDQILSLIQKETYLKAERELPPIIKERFIGFKKVEVADIVQQDMLQPDSEGRVWASVYKDWE